MKVYLTYDGTAASGADYVPLPHEITIPAGSYALDLLLLPLNDELAEGPEVVRATLLPANDATHGYLISPFAADAMIVIGDDEKDAPKVRLDILQPLPGSHFESGSMIEISALGVWTEGEVAPVEFFAGDIFIGATPPPIWARPTIPGLPSIHTIVWTNPPAGEHVLTARFKAEPDVDVTSPPVTITVGSPSIATVRIEATGRIAEEDASPLERLPLRGEFTVSRTGPTNESLLLFIQYTGTATFGEDYPTLPIEVEIPAGATNRRIVVEPFPDDVREGIETVTAAILSCPPCAGPICPAVACFGPAVEPGYERATVFIRDDGITRASLAITRPEDGARFAPGERIVIEAVAIDLDGYISRVEFLDNEKVIGVSEIFFFLPPEPGAPIFHHFEWNDAEAGSHLLIARAPRENDFALTSPPVSITVGPDENQTPTVAITDPKAGSEFPPGVPIEIVAETRDPDGYVRVMEFFADNLKIGEVIVDFIQPPPPGQTQSFSFPWHHASPGSHRLTARATDNEGAVQSSAPVEIEVTLPSVPIVTVFTRDAMAVEPAANAAPDNATFVIRRFGPTNEALFVSFSLHGTAHNGVDYETLESGVTIPAGRRSVAVTVQPLSDNLVESEETVILQIEESPLAGPLPGYEIGTPRRAVALISDRPTLAPANDARCVPLPDGLFHICMPAENGHNYRLEASTDLRTWESIYEGVADDGALHFVDESNRPQRFYRLIPEPNASPVE